MYKYIIILGLILIPNIGFTAPQYFGEILEDGHTFEISTAPLPNTYWTINASAQFPGGTACASGAGADPIQIGVTFDMDNYLSGSGCDEGIDYYLNVWSDNPPTIDLGFYKLHNISEGNWTTDEIPDTGTSTRVWLSEPEANSTSTTPVFFIANYYLNSTTNGSSTPTSFNIKIFNSLLGSGTQFYKIPIENPEYNTIVSTSTLIALPDNQFYIADVDLVEEEIDPICNNPLLAVAYCGWQQATQNIIASDNSFSFTVGTSPFESIDAFGNSIFSASGIDQGIFQGQCAFVATSTCEMTSINTWQGCMFNVGLRLFCPTTGAINFATTTLLNSFNNKIPFGFFTMTIGKIQTITGSTTPTLGQDITVNITQLGNATTTIFSWESAKTFMDNVIPNNVINILIYFEWISFSLYALMRVANMHD